MKLVARGVTLAMALGACSHDAPAARATAAAPDVAQAHAAPATDPALLVPFDPPGAATPAPLHPMRGPYVDLDAYCLAFVRLAIEHGGPDGAAAPSCVPTESGLDGGVSRVTGAGAMFEARVFTSNDGSGGATRCRVAACTTRGWYVDAEGMDCARGRAGGELALRDIVPGGEREVVFRAVTGEDDELTVCGVGASGRPSCQTTALAVPMMRQRRAGRDVAVHTPPATPTSLTLTFP